MVRKVTQMVLLALVVVGPALAQNTAPPLRMWYRGPFEGWVDLKAKPDYGYYYQPAPNSAYPLNEQAYGQPIHCDKCGHTHYPGNDVCPYCRQRCPAGGNDENPNTVYTPRPLPGFYYYEKQPHYRFASPMRLGGTYRKYNQPF